MSQVLRYSLVGVGILIAGFLVWYFGQIVAYILISSVLSLIGKPLVHLLGKFRIWKWRLPKALRALIVLLTMWGIFIAFFTLVIPLVAAELDTLSQTTPEVLFESYHEQLLRLDAAVQKYQLNSDSASFNQVLNDRLENIFNVTFLTNFFSSVAEVLGNIFIALFSITFISFFFLKDEYLFRDFILSLVPDKHVEAFSHAMASVRHLLMRYFIGIGIQVSGIFTIVTVGLTIVGLEFSQSILIGLIAGILNVIPYLGPIMGASIGILLGIATHMQYDFYSELLPLLGFMILVFAIAQVTDNFVFQPFIYSNSVNAHPLEIFIVIMLAASMAGIAGMILAIPAYTVLRAFAKEFFNKFKVVKKLTNKIS